MGDVDLVLSWCIAGVLASAGAGKLAGRTTRFDALVIAAEFALAVLLIGHVTPRVTAAAAVVVSGGYLVYAITRHAGERCACFGSRLPRSGRVAQIVRNALLALVAVLLLLITTLEHDARSIFPVIASTAGLGLAGLIVVGPWLGEWALSTSPEAHE
jgi:hypothetical protein